MPLRFYLTCEQLKKEVGKKSSELKFMLTEKENTSGVTGRVHIGKCKTREIYWSLT